MKRVFSKQTVYLRHPVYKGRAWLRTSDLSLILSAAGLGVCAGLATVTLAFAAHSIQHVLYGVGINRLSALASIRHPLKLLFLPLGGGILGGVYWLSRRRGAPIDVVEANALHGGRIPPADTFWVGLQTLISNGFGASVGLEAAYAQTGGGIASAAGQWLRLRRADMRNLVGAGAGAAIGAAFAAPLTGAFYAFEVVIGTYTPAAIAPVATAALSAALVSRAFGETPYLTVASVPEHITTLDYLLFSGLGVLCAVAGILMMRMQSWLERLVSAQKLPSMWRPLVGGMLLVPIALASPQALSSGHGALSLDIELRPAVTFLAFVFAMKALASTISISFGFRGGLFFASLFLGSLLGPIYAQLVNDFAGHEVVGNLDAALVGMAAFATAVVGAPMTLSLLVLETTQDFALTGVVIAASLCASAFTRANFGYSFSTWRFHVRGASIRSARDIGWSKALTARRLMRRDPTMVSASATIAEFRARVPLGSTSRVLLTGPDREYRGLVETARAYDPGLDQGTRISEISRLPNEAIAPVTGITQILGEFERLKSEDLAVVDDTGRILGVLTEAYVQRRYIEESEKSQSQMFGES